MKKSLIYIIHILFWVFLYFSFWYVLRLMPFISRLSESYPLTDNVFLLAYCGILIISLILPFYFGYFIAPRLFKKNSQKRAVAIAVLFAVIYPVAGSIFDDGFVKGIILQTVFLFAFLNGFMILGIIFRSLFEWIKQKQIQETMEKQNIKSELALMKTQLNPHFLFNTIHNIDALINENPQKASLSLIKLSEIMRYMIYESNTENVELKNELEYLRNYIELEKLRLKNPHFITFKIEGNLNNKNVAPMLFIPFIENIFKHTADINMDSRISIFFSIKPEHIHFSCSNPIEKEKTEKDETHGIGLNTVKKRLELIYPEKHRLTISENNSNFMVDLDLFL